MNNEITSIDFAHRWLRDGLLECGRAGAVEALDVDATVATEILRHLKADGTHVTWTHIFVRATAIVLARHPELHQLIAGNTRLQPLTVDICLSIAGDASVTPVIIIENAAGKDLEAIACEITRLTPQATEEANSMLNALRRFGWLVPFSFCRRALVAFLLRRLWYRRKVSGTFQVSCIPHVDVFSPLIFNTAGALGVGRVRDRVIAINGQPVVRPMVTLFCCFDHSVWNGMAAAKFLSTLRSVVESGEFTERPPNASEPQRFKAV